MIESFIYFLLALLGLGFLIFIHELGHYFMAKKVGMKIEVFSIGLGKPFFSWMFQNVRWQLCYLPFGGYVKIAGEKEEIGSKEPLENTFYGKGPFDRIKVAVMGPVVNIVFAFILFTAIWTLGGKLEPFSKHTNLIGYVDPSSEIYKKGVKPGDQILTLNQKPFKDFKDLLYAAVSNEKTLAISGNKIDYIKEEIDPFNYVLTPYVDPRMKGGEFKTIGVLAPASLLIFTAPDASSDFRVDKSPIKNSGIESKDRIVWANGEMIFSMAQLNKIVNEKKVMLTIKRGSEIFLTKVPRVKVSDLRLKKFEKAELEDWQHETSLKGPLKDLEFIPYQVSESGFIKDHISYLGDDAQLHTVYDENEISSVLKEGDKIVAVDGREVKNGYDFFKSVQKKRVRLIVQRGVDFSSLNYKDQNQRFIDSINGKDLSNAISAITSGEKEGRFGQFVALKSIEPILLSDLPLSEEKRNYLTKELLAQQEQVDKIKDAHARQKAQQVLEKSKSKLVLGLPLSDAEVIYNPNPWAVFTDVIAETFRTLSSLVTGKIHPKWMSGPIGMVQIIHHGWSVGFKEGLFWMATISLNLGVFNLLPLPVLDGGHICFALYEKITRRRLSPKMMEKLVIPFIAALIGLFIYVTYQDILRLFSSLF